MENNEIITTDYEVLDDVPVECENSNNGLKTVGALALTAAIGTALFFGVKKVVKKIKDKKAASIEVEETEEDEDE